MRTVEDVAQACETVVNDSPVDCQSRRGTEHLSVRPVPTKSKLTIVGTGLRLSVLFIQKIQKNILR